MSLLRLRSALSLSSPIYQLRRQVSSLPLQNHTTPTSAATFPFPVPRDPSSPPLKLPTDIISKFDYTASHVLAKVKILIDLSNLDAAAEYARLAVLVVPKSPRDTRTKAETCRLIIGSMCREKRFEEAYELFHYFFNVNNVEPDVPCFSYVVYALINQGRLDEAFRFNRRKISNGHYCPGSDTLMNALIDAGRIDEAYSLFLGGCTYPVFIRGFLAHGNIDKANKLFQDLKQGHEAYPSYGAEYIEMSQVAYMEHFFKQGKDEEAMQWYRSTISKYCLKQGKDDEQGTVDNRIPKTWENRADTVNAVLKVLLKYGKKTEAWSLFDKLCGKHSDIERKEVDKWTNQETRCIMIRECFETGEISKAVEIARTKEAWDGNAECYTTLVTRFVRQGMMSEADEMFNEMFSSVRFPMYCYLGIHRVMVDGFAKAGRFDDAHRFVNKIADISLNNVSRRVDFSLSTGRGFFI